MDATEPKMLSDERKPSREAFEAFQRSKQLRSGSTDKRARLNSFKAYLSKIRAPDSTENESGDSESRFFPKEPTSAVSVVRDHSAEDAPEDTSDVEWLTPEEAMFRKMMARIK